ncbi:MAG: hypothetical protein IJ895_03345 [Prevotella sp.]|nr:hypothetical protein [Prevotella sp.]MBR4650751.1 hypothetical protein [Prevotella sp.]
MKKEYIEPSVKAVEIKMNQILAGSEVIPVNTETANPEESDGFDAEFEDDF